MTPFDAFAEALRAFAARHPEARPQGGHALELAIPGCPVEVQLDPPGGAPAAWVGRHAALRYRLRGAPADGPGAARARALLEELVRALAALDAEVGARLACPTLDDPGALARLLAAGPPPLRDHPGGPWARLGPALIADPGALVPLVDAAHRRLAGRNDRLPPIEGLPPCLDLSMRPAPRLPVGGLEACRGCAAAVGCAVTSGGAPRAGAASGRAPRPLAHRDPLAAALAAAGAIAAAWGAPPIGEPVLRALFASRQGLLPDEAAAPIELSLKREGAALEPQLRLVEYPAPAGRDQPPRSRLQPAWRRRLLDHAARLAPGAAEALAAFVARVEAAQGPEVEMSLGVELALLAQGARVQLYAHVEPRDRAKMARTLEAALGWAGAARDAEAARELLGLPGCDLALVAGGLSPGGAPTVKAYFTLPLGARHASTGLEPARPAELAGVAAAEGLAVLEAGPEGLRPLKWDFPCAPHFQRAEEAVEAFLSPLDELERARGRAILTSPAFRAWPTWLSARPGASTFYFVPR